MGTELMTIMREFCGWLSADVPALHAVEVPTLAASLDRFFAVRHLCTTCGKRMTYTATAPIADAPMEWRCFACPVDLGSVATATMKTECCGVIIATDQRFCPKCGYECRVTKESV